jgi:Tol biopolymer transport system component
MKGENEQGIATWSADGKRLCFGDIPLDFDGPVGTEAIHIFDLRTHELVDLAGSQGLWTCRWSPDGRYISALTVEGGRLEVFDFKTHAWRSTNAVRVNNPNWSTDGKYVYYDTEVNNRSLQRVRVWDGKVEELANLRDFPSAAEWWSGLSPNNDPLVLRNLGWTEIYSLSLEYK